MKILNPESLLTLLGVDYSEKTNRLSMLCPWHDDTDPSSGIYLDTQKFFCFSCEILLDLIGFYAKYKEIPRADAERELEKEFGILPKGWKVDRVALARRLAQGDHLLADTKSGLPLQQHAYLAEQLDRALMFFERGRLDEGELDKVLEIWYNKVEEALNGVDPRRTPGIGLDAGLTKGMGQIPGPNGDGGYLDLE